MKCSLNARCEREACRYAHTQYEIDYHPLVYKGYKCEYSGSDNFSCMMIGERCPGAHGEQDLREIKKIINDLEQNVLANHLEPEIIQIAPIFITKFEQSTFKTQPCPNGSPHNFYQCLYYHNPLERRRPYQYEFVNSMCRNIFINGVYNDPSLCSMGDQCKSCHTKNEFYYHQLNFRKKACVRKQCVYGEYCPDIHYEIIREQEGEHQSNNEDDKEEEKEKLKEKINDINKKCEEAEQKLVLSDF